MIIDKTPTFEAIKGKKIAQWTVEDDGLVKHVNIGTPED